MCDNEITVRSERKFQNHVIIRIRQKRSPEIVNILESRKGSKLPQKAQRRVNAGFWRKVLCPCQHGHPFHVKGNGEANFKTPQGNHFNQGKAGASTRTSGGHHYTCIQNNSHKFNPQNLFSFVELQFKPGLEFVASVSKRRAASHSLQLRSSLKCQ